jgi:hypothetical protein
MSRIEPHLIDRYIELESRSGTLGPVEYNSRLNYLEKERLLLEEQRYKMQVLILSVSLSFSLISL